MATETVLFDICDYEVFEMHADTPGASAGPSYGPSIDVPGVNAFTGFDPQIVSAELKGDCRVIARQGRIDSMNAGFQAAKLALGVLNAVYQGIRNTVGDDEIFRMKGGAETRYFKMIAHITGTDAGVEEAKVILYKAQVTGSTLFDQSSDNYGQPRFDTNGIGIDSGVDDPDDSESYPTLVKNLMADIVIKAA